MMEVGEKGEINELDESMLILEENQHSVFQNKEKCVYLRSQIMHGDLPNLSTKINKKIETVMKELTIPDKPIPTAKVHTAYDELRKSVLKMFSLQIYLKEKKEEARKV
jgi:hypothetical protein